MDNVELGVQPAVRAGIEDATFRGIIRFEIEVSVFGLVEHPPGCGCIWQ